jgi:lipopolysaccharide transport system ATP-binding protein
MDNEVTIRADQLSKKFSKSLKRSMLYGTTELARNLIGRPVKAAKLRPREFWAVDKVDLELKRGQVLGIIGPNGCGKTTLLRLIAGIYPPDHGSVMVRGRVAALISLGVGFHPYLTGLENIFLNGTLLGMSKKEIESKLEQIIEFSELGDFIDTPVSNYSSGMRVRLGFSIAIVTEPDVLLLDEILAVGDRTFKAKSYSKIEKLSEKTTSIFITHNMQMVSRICSEIAVMDKGQFVFKSPKVDEGIEFYQRSQIISQEGVSGAARVELYEFKVGSANNQFSDWIQLHTSESLKVSFTASIFELPGDVVARIMIYDSDLNIVGETLSTQMLFSKVLSAKGEQEVQVEVSFPPIALRAGTYTLSLIFVDLKNNILLKKFHSIASFLVIDDTIAKDSLISRALYYYDSDWKLKL